VFWIKIPPFSLDFDMRSWSHQLETRNLKPISGLRAGTQVANARKLIPRWAEHPFFIGQLLR